MDQIKKYIDFLSSSYPQHTDEERHSFSKSEFKIPESITRWWVMCCNEFARYVYGSGDLIGGIMFGFIKSCQYTDQLMKESEVRNKKIKHEITKLREEFVDQLEGRVRKQSAMEWIPKHVILKHKIDRLDNRFTNVEKVFYDIMTEISELKEHNKHLSARILELEKPPVILF